MESGYEPFEVVEKEWQTILRLRGTEEQRAKVEADRVHIIMNAIARGWDIDVRYADIDGDVDIREIANELERTEDGNLVIEGNIRMFGCNINGNADFRFAQFSGNADFYSAQFTWDASFRDTQFTGDADFGFAYFLVYANFGFAQFTGDANFLHAQFTGDASFGDAQFTGDANFWGTQFTGDANFWNVVMARPANFTYVEFRENHVFKGLWNATLGRIKRLHWKVTDFSGFNTERAMDGASNPWLKRYIDDELWIQSWRERSWWREPLFIIWELTSHCGRSIGLWAFWSALIAAVFAFVYRAFGPESITFNVARLYSFQPDIWDYLYYSVVTFTTLGFGDIVPLTKPARLAVGAEVVLGYVMLGGLISIFANKLARRS